VSEARPRGRLDFLALIGLGILNHTVLAGGRVTVSLYALSLGASPLIVGSLIGFYAFFPMFLSVSAGRLSDRIGVRRPSCSARPTARVHRGNSTITKRASFG